MTSDGAHPCTRDQLAAVVREAPAVRGVWTPEHDAIVRPERVPFLVEAYREHAVAGARKRVLPTAAGVLGVAVLAVLLADPVTGVPPLLLLAGALAGVWLLGAVYGVRSARRTVPEDFARMRQNGRHALWAAEQPAPYTMGLGIVLGAVYLLQQVDPDVSVAAAGLVKEAVAEGEVWRLATGAMLHGSLLHLAANGSALLALGRYVEVHTSRFRLATVFLVSAVAGSLFSQALSPASSVGASGGIMGFVGFLAVLAARRPGELPDDFLSRMLYAVAATAALGVLGFALIDNWAHLGGLLGGAALGVVLVPREGSLAGGRVLGWASVAGVLLAAAGAAAAMLGAY